MEDPTGGAVWVAAGVLLDAVASRDPDAPADTNDRALELALRALGTVGGVPGGDGADEELPGGPITAASILLLGVLVRQLAQATDRSEGEIVHSLRSTVAHASGAAEE